MVGHLSCTSSTLAIRRAQRWHRQLWMRMKLIERSISKHSRQIWQRTPRVSIWRRLMCAKRPPQISKIRPTVLSL